MSYAIHSFVTASCELLGLGEPLHQEADLRWVRNNLFSQLVEHGFRSIALEIDRVAAFTVDDFVQDGVGRLDEVMRVGFSHDFGALEGNRELVTWMREYNDTRPPEQRLTFHGFDGQMENMSAPSPRHYLEYARDYLKLDLDIASLVGADDRWSRTEAILDPAASPGATPEAERLRAIADEMHIELYARAPELISATSLAEWRRAATYLTAGLALLRYHKQSSRPLEPSARISGLLAARGATMAQNLLDIRQIEARRGPTLVFAHNIHLQHTRSLMPMGDMNLEWYSAGAILGSLLGDRYTFLEGTLTSGTDGAFEVRSIGNRYR